jgi:hypothetical protein
VKPADQAHVSAVTDDVPQPARTLERAARAARPRADRKFKRPFGATPIPRRPRQVAISSANTRPRSLAQLQEGVPVCASSPSTPCWRGA